MIFNWPSGGHETADCNGARPATSRSKGVTSHSGISLSGSTTRVGQAAATDAVSVGAMNTTSAPPSATRFSRRSSGGG
ncbi:hypothetical protein [Arthrobacter sp. SDTb3-6]|uniref:hypothetical protein n=1 Tax=Arthrobacter sp. SDTb3-6 TaxID=2713571 RepID=UPI00159E9386|nr:hypothetical protein [Arthrobacter sp. SDTb3-6]NVM98102.1 hypothetical protein [Arthrobacter sp. SDTb3-6]